MPAERKNYPGPALASALVAGSGQMVKGEAKKGLKMMLWFYLGFPILVFGSLLLGSYVFLIIFAFSVIIYPAFWVFNIFDAYSSQTIKRRRS